ncbi:response regulator [Bradyrhizobium japonicum]|uniref:response regulator n=1 Tax=Bradyrhizobium japonicum TaxID=375 RepID=UPI002012F23A|nr:response regulator [Bradyrhizobium japonicum]
MKAIRILVVEDETFVRMDAVEMLREAGFDILEAVNADEAIRLLALHSDIRLIFTDIDMAGSINGLELATIVQKRWPPIRIVSTSGHYKIQAGDLPAGARFFFKPYQPTQIIDAVHELINATWGEESH